MVVALLSLTALIGAPLMAGLLGWRVYCGTPWRLPDANRFERASIALGIALSIFSGWIGICHNLLEAIRP